MVQIDEPYMQARPDEAREFGLEALNRALDGVQGTTAVHICFGYAALIHARSTAYSFLPELAGCHCQQVSLETAQPNLDCSILKTLNGKKIMLGTLDLGDRRDRDAGSGRGAHPARAAIRARGTAHRRARLRPQVPEPGRRLRKAQGDGRRGRHTPRGDGAGTRARQDPIELITRRLSCSTPRGHAFPCW